MATLISNGDAEALIQDFIKLNLGKMFPKNDLWKIQGFDVLISNLAQSYKNLPPTERRRVVLSLVSNHLST